MLFYQVLPFHMTYRSLGVHRAQILPNNYLRELSYPIRHIFKVDKIPMLLRQVELQYNNANSVKYYLTVDMRDRWSRKQ